MSGGSLGGSTRFGDTTLAFGMERFTSQRMTDGGVLWRFYVSKYCGPHDRALISIDATLPALREMRRFIDKAIEDVESDGGRKSNQEPST